MKRPPADERVSQENRSSGKAFDPRKRFVTSTALAAKSGGSTIPMLWTLAMLCVGLLTVAACVLIPLREENARLARELNDVADEATFMHRQAEANALFIEKVHTDPALAERLMMRSTRRPAAGKEFLNEQPAGSFGSSPYAMTQLTPPAEKPAYQSDLPPLVASLFTDTRGRVVMMSAGLFLMIASLALGGRERFAKSSD